MMQENFKYYRPSETQKALIGYQPFKYRFQQIQNTLVTDGFFSKIKAFAQWKLNHVNYGIPSDLKKLDQQLPMVKTQFNTKEGKIRYTWIGHSTAVINPVFAKRCSPVKFIGPQRFRQPACKIQELPHIDAVFISHDHYDHLDSDALEQLQKLYHPIFFVGLRSNDVLPQNCKIIQLDWTDTSVQQIKGKQFKITFVPVCHWSRRGANDQNYRLWGGFVIQTPKKKKIFYAGDTGYCEIFKQLGDQFGGFDLSILPIGAYEPRQFLKAQHVNPQEAVIIHKDIKSKKSVGVHWGTFPLGYQHYTAARKDLKQACNKYQLEQQQFITVSHGGSFEIDY